MHPARKIDGLLGLLAAVLMAASTHAAVARPPVDVFVVDQTSERVVLEYTFGWFDMTAVSIDGVEYDCITLGRESQILEAGMPDLPNVCRSVIIPDATGVDARVLDAEFYLVEDVDIAPSKGNLPRSIDPATVPYTFGDAYALDADYPGTLVSLGRPYILRDYRGVVVRVNPFQYNPVRRTLRVYTRVTVEIKNTAGKTVNIRTPRGAEGRNPAFDQIYSRHFVNYGSDLRYAPLDESGDMLIICHDPWIPNVMPLVDHKNSLGIDTTVVSVSSIGNDAGLIKSYIQGVYDSEDLAFVLLVGDAAQVATPCSYDGDADPTYALLAGDDHYPEILVGRFSAETAAQVDTQVVRTISYESRTATHQWWFKKAVGIGSLEGDGRGDDGEADWVHIENIRTDLLAQGYDPVDGIYGYEATAEQVSDAVNEGRGVINYCGHGYISGWGTSYFDSGDVNTLVNDNMLPFIFSVSCHIGNFADYTCFAETWLRATHGDAPTGAIGVYGSSVVQHWAPPMCAQDEAIDLLCAQTYSSFGTLCFAGACQMIDEYGEEGEQMFDTWNVFGDPSLRVVGVAEPVNGLFVIGSDLVAAGDRGGPFSPDAAVYTLENKNATPLDYEVTASVAWLDISNAAGTLPPLDSVEVAVSLNEQADLLTHGYYEGAVYFTNLDDHVGDTDRFVSIDVDDRDLRYAYTLDTDPGWSTEGAWAYGQPMGLGSVNGDPNAGYTGDAVYGYNLYGDYSYSMPPYYLTTPPIDCHNFSFVQLRFWRWLGVEEYVHDQAAIEVSNDGVAWTEVWHNPEAWIVDDCWTQMVLDISAIADGEPTVQIRWRMGPTDEVFNCPGWNIDDVEIWGVLAPKGDLDGDGDVDLYDLATLLGNYGMLTGATPQDGDTDGDGDVDLSDLAALLANYGMGW